MKTLSLFLFVLCFQVYGLMAQTEEKLNFPDDFFGVYTGTLKINAESGSQEVPMEFHLKPTDSIGKYHYTLVYGEGDMRQERKYTLLTEDVEKGRYVVDENNGILLDDKVVGNKLYSLFEVEGNLLTTFMTFHKEYMIFEITFSSKKKQRVTYADNEQKTEVISYPISTVQQAVLKKQ